MRTESASNNAVFFGAGWHFIIGASFLGVLGALCLHHLIPSFVMILQGVHHLGRGLVEGALFGFSGAGFHAVSVA